MIPDVHRQRGARVRFEWGMTGAEAVAPGAAYVVVIDILSFTTTVTVAVERGITVYPFDWKDDRAAAYADELGAVLGVSRVEASKGGRGALLSPAAMSAAEGIDRIVLPSANGSPLSAKLAATGATVIAGSLRNRTAVASWLASQLGPDDELAVIAGGERWTDGTLRPAVEDLWGAGAVIAALVERGVGGLSPEARVAADAFRSVADRLEPELLDCASGRELAAIGYAEDTRVAAGLDASDVVPILGPDGSFRATLTA